MDKLKQIEAFVAVASRGGLTAAAAHLNTAPIMVGRRLDALEERLGVKLLLRTTRRVSLTNEGAAYLEDCQRLLADLNTVEASVSAGGVRPSGHLRLTAPAGFGRKHVAPLVAEFHLAHPEVTVSLSLSDRMVDIVGEGFDCGVRVGDLPDSSLIAVRLADNRRLCVATPAYLARHGTPKAPQDLYQHQCLTLSSDASQTRGWAFKSEDKTTGEISGKVDYMRPSGPLNCSDGQVLHAWCLADYGIAWRSIWEVQSDVAAGRLVTILDDYAAAPNGIYAVYAQRKHLPLRLQLWVDFLKHHYGLASYWKKSS
jgi:DNA-binding transcriptional LysR family regulator